MDPFFEIELELAAKGSRDSARQLFRQLEAAILDGRLTVGAKLPPTRKSAAFFGIARNTAIEVYERLLQAGLVVSRRGAGTFVAARPPPAARADIAPDTAADARLNPFWLQPDTTAAIGFWRDSPPAPGRAEVRAAAPDIDFRPALVDSRLFPFEVFRRVSAQQLRGLERKPASFRSAQGNQGNYRLRAAITRHIGLTRAVVCEAEDIVVTCGAQQAFDLLARVLVRREQTVVAIEDPGYPPLRVAFAAAGARLVPVPVDNEGLIVEQLPADAGVICVCPSHQFPLGASMSPRRRKALLAFARARNAVIVEDDYDGEFRYDGSPLEALRTAEAADVVCYVGTFSKCMLPALRLGYIVAPAWARATLIAAKNCLDWHCATPLQTGVAAFIAEGHLAQHVRRLREIYRQRRELLLALLHSELGDWLAPIPGSYGMHVAALARVPCDLEAVAGRLLAQRVKLHGLARYFLGPTPVEGLVFGYGAVDLPGIERGLALLRQALDG